jgi:hypothetical protein
VIQCVEDFNFGNLAFRSSTARQFITPGTLNSLPVSFSFSTFIYNAASPPDILLGVSVLQNRQPVIVVAPKRVEPNGLPDLRRIPYAAEVALGDMVPGRYVLQVTIIDQTTKRTATQEFKFAVR